MRKDWYTKSEAIDYLSDKLRRKVSLDEIIERVLNGTLDLYVYPLVDIFDSTEEPQRNPFPSKQRFLVCYKRSNLALLDCLATSLTGNAEHKPDQFSENYLFISYIDSESDYVFKPVLMTYLSEDCSLIDHFVWQFSLADLEQITGGELTQKVSSNSLELMLYLQALFLTRKNARFQEEGSELKYSVLAEELSEAYPGVRGVSKSNIEKALRAGKKRYDENFR